MLRCSHLTRTALLSATLMRRATTTTTNPVATPQTPKDVSAAESAKSAPDAASAAHPAAGLLQHSKEESNVPSPHFAPETLYPPPPHRQPKFLFKGRRGSISPEYYSTRSAAGHPDAVAELLGAGRDDPEWMWLKLLCFLCTMATFGTTLYGYFFAEHVKYFKDEPWSPFTY